MKRMKLLFTIALPVMILQNNANAQSSRLIGKANWANNGTVFTLRDTTSYNYSGGNGGDLTHPMMFDNATTWVNADTALNPTTLLSQEIDSVTHKLMSTTTQVWTSGGWSNSSKVLYYYNSDGTLSYMINQVWSSTGRAWANISRNMYTYLGGNLSTNTYQTFDGLMFNSVSQKMYFYTGTLLTQEVDQTLGSSMSFTARYDYSYNSANKLAAWTYNSWSGTAFVPQYTYTNMYDTAGNRTSSTYQTYDASGSAVNVSMKNYSYTGGNVTGEIDQNWDTADGGAYKNVMNYAFGYNSLNQLKRSEGTAWNIGGFWEHAAGDPLAYYYYNTFDPNLGVNQVNAGGSVNVFPNPVTNVVNINVNFNEAQVAQVNIFDMNGSLIRSWALGTSSEYNTQISTESFAAGMYTVQIAGAKSTIVKQFVVVR